MTWYTFLFHIFFPVSCIVCKKKNTVLCADCASQRRLPNDPPHTYICAKFSYKDPFIKKLLWKFKYTHEYAIGKTLGTYLRELFFEDYTEWHILYPHIDTIIIPVPSSETHMKKRGYNPSEIIARSMIKDIDSTHIYVYTDILKKNPEIRAQSSIIHRQERLRNIRGAFTLHNQEILKNKHIVIVDDITTTGGTIEEIKKLCIKAGARKVSAYVVAH